MFSEKRLVAEVKVGQRLVQDQDWRFLSKRAGDEYQLAFSSRNLAINTIGEMADLELAKHSQYTMAGNWLYESLTKPASGYASRQVISVRRHAFGRQCVISKTLRPPKETARITRIPK